MTVITPERQVLDTDADSVIIPAHDGELGILHGRAPLMCELGIGRLSFRSGGQTRRLFIDGGFAQVYNNQVTVLTERGLAPAEITDSTLAQTQAESRSDDPEERARARRRASVLRALRS